MYLNGQIAHGVCGAGVEVAVILVRCSDTVGLGSLPDFTFQQQRAAEAAGTASAVAVAPSYIEAFDTSSPVRAHIMLWYSNMYCRVPCDISGW